MEIGPHCKYLFLAAVADVRSDGSVEGKIQKENLSTINLVRNPDLLADLSLRKRNDQVLVGFAAETEEHFESRGREKLQRKGLDLLYVNNVSNGKVFAETVTSGSLLTKEGGAMNFVESDKFQVARSIVKEISKRLVTIHG